MYRYGFNGKERDNSFGNVHYDYGFRIYNPKIGKFLSVDPLSSQYPMLTPYQYASNSPIMNIDLDGLEGIPAPIAEFGYYVELKMRNASEVVEEYSWKAWEVSKGIGKGLYNIAQGFSPQNKILTQEDLNRSLQEMYIDPITNFPGQVKDIYENGTLEEKTQLTTELGFTALTLGRSVKGFTLRNFRNTKGITLKDPSPQVGPAYESFAAGISEGRINISGRAVTNGKFDFVITNEGQLILGRGHSHLAGGAKSVQAAGEISLHQGKVKSITNSSGHFKPTISEGENFGNLLKQGGVDVSGAKLKLYNSQGALEKTTILE